MVGHQRGELSGQVKDQFPCVQPECKPRSRVRSVRKKTKWWVMGDPWLWYPKQQLTGVAVGQGVCVSRDKEDKRQSLKYWQGGVVKGRGMWLTCPCWPGGSLWKDRPRLDKPYVLIQCLSKVSEIIWWTLPISHWSDGYTRGKYSVVALGAIWVFVIYWKEK